VLDKKIKFISKYKDSIPNPKPSLLHIPKEYKNMQTYFDNSQGLPGKTLKKCIPFLDALTCGYIIPFPIDYSYRYDEENEKAFFEINETILQSEAQDFEVTTHISEQVPNEIRYNRRTVEAVFKFNCPWIIKTPPGYSCIFTQPFNRNYPFKIIDGVVDTDSFNLNINFPFYWTNFYNEKVMLRQGTPMVLVMPFKRDSWKMECVEETKEELEKRGLKYLKAFGNYVDNYKKIFWKKKNYK
jgi:hypothetical protein